MHYLKLDAIREQFSLSEMSGDHLQIKEFVDPKKGIGRNRLPVVLRAFASGVAKLVEIFG